MNDLSVPRLWSSGNWRNTNKKITGRVSIALLDISVTLGRDLICPLPGPIPRESVTYPSQYTVRNRSSSIYSSQSGVRRAHYSWVGYKSNTSPILPAACFCSNKGKQEGEQRSQEPRATGNVPAGLSVTQTGNSDDDEDVVDWSKGQQLSEVRDKAISLPVVCRRDNLLAQAEARISFWPSPSPLA